MLELSEIKSYYPKKLHKYPRFLLREYLQYQILNIIYDSKYSDSLIFMGGTCLRIVHGNNRFSEDLDFDNTALSEQEFEKMAEKIELELSRKGYEVEMETTLRGAWHCYIKIPGILFEEDISGHRNEKILIQIDTEPQKFDYEPEKIILNKFEVFSTIFTTPLSLLLSQKLFTIINRNRKMGRDFFDVVFLMSKNIKPNYEYINKKAGISSSVELKEKILESCQRLDMQSLAKDVEPFLFNRNEVKRVELFEEYFRNNFKTE